MRPTVAEINAMVALLKQDWESSSELAKALIEALDEVRGSRPKLFAAVVQYGHEGNVFYSGVGPIAGLKTAQNVLEGMLFNSLTSKGAIIPIKNLEGHKAHMKEIDK